MDIIRVTSLNLDIYQCVSPHIITDEVIITKEQIKHIKERHPGDYELFSPYFQEIINSPDYIIQSTKPNTAIILKRLSIDNITTQTILRLSTTSDSNGIKNSILTFMKINRKRYERYLRTKRILYRNPDI